MSSENPIKVSLTNLKLAQTQTNISTSLNTMHLDFKH